jgi:hypothetical protein
MGFRYVQYKQVALKIIGSNVYNIILLQFNRKQQSSSSHTVNCDSVINKVNDRGQDY